ncbi:winged helix-turn-helix transcriptional regulator [Streptomyces sp. NPDC002076]
MGCKRREGRAGRPPAGTTRHPPGLRGGRPARWRQVLLDRGGAGDRRRAGRRRRRCARWPTARTGCPTITGQTGAPPDILTDRLGKENAGVITRRRHCGHPPRYEYHLSQAGRVLLPVMPALREWGDKRAVTTAPLDSQHLRPPGGDNPRRRPCDASVLQKPDRAPTRPSRTLRRNRGPHDSGTRRREGRTPNAGDSPGAAGRLGGARRRT